MLSNFLAEKKLIDVENILQLDSAEYKDLIASASDNATWLADVIQATEVPLDFLEAVICYSKQAELRATAQQRLITAASADDRVVKNFLSIVQNSQFTDSRKWAAQQLNDEVSLKAAYKWIQSKDKSTARLLHDKLDALKASVKIKQRQQAQLAELMQAIQQLSTSAFTPQYRGRYLLLVEQREALDFEMEASDQQTFELYRQAAATALNSFQQIEQAHQRQTAIIEQLTNLWMSAQSQSLEVIASSLQAVSLPAIELEWHQSLKLYHPEDAAREAFHQHFQRLTVIVKWIAHCFSDGDIDDRYQHDYLLLDTALNDQSLMTGMENTEMVKTIRALHATLQRQFQQQKQQDNELIKQLDKQFGIAFHLKKQGNYKSIHNYIERINKKMAKLQQPALVKKIQLRLATLEQELQEATDWASFAVKPKFERLCSEMESLASLTMPIPNKAQAIQKLQKQWKTLGFVEGNDQLWDRFKQAADRAYAPCSEYFEQRQQYRDGNTQELVSLCEALELLLQHEELDGAQLQKQCQLIDKSWYKKRDLDHKKIAELRERYQATRQQIEQRLEQTYYASIVQQREGLIERLTKLVAADISAHAEHQVKLLQSAWKQTGSLPKKLDNELWNAFKAQLDAFYQKRRDRNQQQRQQANQPLDEAKTIIDELKQLVKTASNDKRFQELQQQFNAIKDLDGKRGSEFKKQFQQLGGKLEKHVYKTQQQSRHAELDELKRRANLCAMLEVGKVEQTEVEQQWEQQPLGNSQWSQLINKRLERAIKGVESSSENPHRRFCVDVEIALGLETPSADKSMRMAIQMELLKNKGFQGDKISDKKAYILEKQVEWLTLSITHAAEFEQLEQRFTAIINQIAND